MLSEFVEILTHFIESLVVGFGAPGVALVALFENLFPPTPSEFLYPLAGKMAYDGKILPIAVIIAGVIGSLIGSLIYYGIGYRLGEDRARSAVARYGCVRLSGFSWTVVSVDDFERGMILFERHGSWIVFAARLLPLVHGVVSIPAGVVHMNLLLFLVYTAIGAALWIAPLTLMGMWLGSSWRQVLNWIDIYQDVLYVLMGLAALYLVVRRWRRSVSSGNHTSA